MKAILLAAGKGTRLHPITAKTPKPLISLTGKPLLKIILDDLQKINLKNIIIVIGHHGEKMKEFIDGEHNDLSLLPIEQKIISGTASALLQAESFINESFIVWLSDTLIPNSISSFYDFITANNVDAIIAVSKIPFDQRKNCGMVEIKDNKIIRLVEKPKHTKLEYGISGLYWFKDNSIFNYCKLIHSNQKNEFDITDGLQKMIDAGKIIMPFFTPVQFIDCGTISGLLQAMRIFLSNLKEQSHIPLNKNCVLSKPLYVGKNVKLGKDCVIGPYVSIGANSKIGNNCTIKNSIILDYSSIPNNSNLQDCVCDGNFQYRIDGKKSLRNYE